MARVFRLTLLALLVLAASARPSRAGSITDIFDPTDQLFGKQSDAVCTGTNNAGVLTDTVSGQDTSGCFSLAYQYDISGQINPPPLTGATLDLYFYDDPDPGNGNPETAIIQVDLGEVLGINTTYTITTGSTSGSPSTATFNVLALLNDGVLDVFLQRGQKGTGQADFFFAEGILNATTGDDETPLPEPVSLLLFGGGIGAVITRQARRRAANS